MVEFGAPPKIFFLIFLDFLPKFKMLLELCCYLRSFSVTPQDRGGMLEANISLYKLFSTPPKKLSPISTSKIRHVQSVVGVDDDGDNDEDGD